MNVLQYSVLVSNWRCNIFENTNECYNIRLLATARRQWNLKLSFGLET